MTTGQKSETEKQEDGMHIWYLVSTLVLQLLMSNERLTVDYEKGDPLAPAVPYDRDHAKCCTGPQRTKRGCLLQGVHDYTGQSCRSRASDSSRTGKPRNSMHKNAVDLKRNISHRREGT